ncbi:MAG: zinc-ribbon domain-containing protein, partial [Bacteroidetes bacterium]|nr:zinc-ribbon domain-containing protein [Bacteroidota bacterium]
MVIYGYNSTFLGGEQLKSATCPECGTQGSMEMGVWRRHAHVFWIPMFPIGKYGVVACTHCNAKFEKKKEIPETVRRDFDQFKSQARGPLWQFSGLGIIAIIVVAVSITSAQNTKRDKAYIAEPIEGDI